MYVHIFQSPRVGTLERVFKRGRAFVLYIVFDVLFGLSCSYVDSRYIQTYSKL